MAVKKKQVENSQVEELDEDSVSDNVDTSPLEGMSKTNAMSVMMKAMASMDDEQWVKFFEGSMAQIGHEADGVPSGAGAQNAASTAMKGAIKEDLAAVFGTTELSEEFKEKATVLFESAVNARVAEIEVSLQEQYEEALMEEIETINAQLVEQIDDYLSYVVEQWAEDNQVAIDRSVGAELAESFMAGLGELYRSHNYNIPEDKVEVVDMMADKVDALEEENNKILVDNIELNNMVEELSKELLIRDLSEDLTPVETEKFKVLVEGFDLDDVDTFVGKLETIKEHHFGKKSTKKNTQLITEEIEYTEDDLAAEQKQTVSPSMKHFVDALERTRRA